MENERWRAGRENVMMFLRMVYNFSTFKVKIKEIEEWFKKELGGVRTGRAAPALLDAVRVEAYGSSMPIKELAAVSVEDARTLRLSPWDTSLSKSIEKGIQLSKLGVSVSVDEAGLRVSFPELTAERRLELIKVAKTRMEEARVSLRLERDRVSQDIEEKKRAGALSEDEKFRAKTEMQKIVEETNKNLEVLFAKKEQEISG